MPKAQSNSFIAACSTELSASGELRLIPAGAFGPRAEDVRSSARWRIDRAIADKLIAQAALRQDRYVIDYEHQTLLAEKNGQPAPAAGWFKTLQWRDGDGLYATDVEWNARARQMIEAGEYRYLSPVFKFAKDGAVQQLLHAALTNTPAVDGLGEVIAALSARFLDVTHNTPEEDHVNETLKKLLATLGLQDSTSEDAAIAAVAALKTKADQVAGLEGQIATLKIATPDPAKFAPVETMQALQQQVAALSTKLNGQELDGVVADALQAGKLLPAQEAWARDLGKKDIASLKTYLEAAPVIVPGAGQSGGKAPAGGAGDGKLSAEDLAVCKQLGIDAETFAKTKGAAA